MAGAVGKGGIHPGVEPWVGAFGPARLVFRAGFLAGRVQPLAHTGRHHKTKGPLFFRGVLPPERGVVQGVEQFFGAAHIGRVVQIVAHKAQRAPLLDGPGKLVDVLVGEQHPARQLPPLVGRGVAALCHLHQLQGLRPPVTGGALLNDGNRLHPIIGQIQLLRPGQAAPGRAAVPLLEQPVAARKAAGPGGVFQHPRFHSPGVQGRGAPVCGGLKAAAGLHPVERADPFCQGIKALPVHLAFQCPNGVLHGVHAPFSAFTAARFLGGRAARSAPIHGAPPFALLALL